MLFASKAAILSFFAYILPCCPSKCLSLLAALMIVNLELSQVRFRSESTYLGNCLDATIAKNFCSLLPPDTESRFLLLPSPQDLPAHAFLSVELGALLGSFSFANFAGLLCLYLLALVGSCGSCCWLLHLHLGLPSKKNLAFRPGFFGEPAAFATALCSSPWPVVSPWQ